MSYELCDFDSLLHTNINTENYEKLLSKLSAAPGTYFYKIPDIYLKRNKDMIAVGIYSFGVISAMILLS